MRNELLSITLLTLCLSTNLFSQGLNNEQYTFDKSDSENIHKFFFGIDTYKFYVNARYNEDYDILIEQYKNKKIIDTTSIITNIIESFGM